MNKMTVDEAGRKGGKARTDRKVEAARRNAQLSEGRPRKALSELTCTCDGGDSVDHKSTCPRGRAIRRRLGKGQPLD